MEYGYIWIVCRRDAIEIKYVEKIIKLSMNVTTHCELVALGGREEREREREREREEEEEEEKERER